jgi:hypothetical protein
MLFLGDFEALARLPMNKNFSNCFYFKSKHKQKLLLLIVKSLLRKLKIELLRMIKTPGYAFTTSKS